VEVATKSRNSRVGLEAEKHSEGLTLSSSATPGLFLQVPSLPTRVLARLSLLVGGRATNESIGPRAVFDSYLGGLSVSDNAVLRALVVQRSRRAYAGLASGCKKSPCERAQRESHKNVLVASRSHPRIGTV